MLFIQTLPQAIWAAVLIAVAGFALWRGGRPERISAVASVAAWIAANLVENRGNWFETQWGILAVDLLLLAVFIWLAVTTGRRWLAWASAFQLLGVVTHAAMTADRSVGSWAYITGNIIFSYMVLVSLAVGTWLHARNRRPDRSQARG